MTLAQQIRILNNKQVNSNFLHQILKFSSTFLKRLWWHLKAYMAIFPIMLLTFASFVFLYIHYFGRKLTQVFQNNTVVEQK